MLVDVCAPPSSPPARASWLEYCQVTRASCWPSQVSLVSGARPMLRRWTDRLLVIIAMQCILSQHGFPADNWSKMAFLRLSTSPRIDVLQDYNMVICNSSSLVLIKVFKISCLMLILSSTEGTPCRHWQRELSGLKSPNFVFTVGKDDLYLKSDDGGKILEMITSTNQAWGGWACIFLCKRLLADRLPSI